MLQASYEHRSKTIYLYVKNVFSTINTNI